MNTNLFGELLGATDLTIDELLAKFPALADEVVALVRQAEVARLQDALSGTAERVRTRVAEVDLTRATGDVVEHLRRKLLELGVEREQVQKVVERAESAGLGQGLPATQAIGAEPVVAVLIATARVHEVGAVAGLDGAAIDILARVAAAPSGLDDTTLSQLVSERELTEAQARDVGFSAALYELVDGDTALASTIRAASFPRLGNAPPASTADLAKLTAADWSRFLSSSAMALPAGVTPESFSSALARRFAALHPAVALPARLPQVDVEYIVRDLQDLAPLFRLNPKLMGVDFVDLITTDLSSSQLARLQTIHGQLAKLIRAYPGLELDAVFDDPQLTPDIKAETVARRTGLLQSVSASLGQLPVLHLDLSTGSSDIAKLNLNRLGATAEEQRMVLSLLRSYQRTWVVAKNIEDTQTLVESGFTSAASIGKQPFVRFQAKSGLDAARAKGLWDEARTSLADVTMTAGAIIDAVNGIFVDLGVSNQLPSAAEYLKDLAGFQELFGSLSFCDCDECQSILGPAAYFVDLMKYIEENLHSLFAGHPKHPLDLKIRRPDLWTLELSCENTKHRMAQLDLVNEILENYIAQRRGYSGPLANRTALGALVYEQTLAQVVDSFHQPFHLPLARIGACLAKLGHTRAEIAATIGAKATVRVQAELGLSARARELLTTPDANLVHLRHIYGLQFGGAASAVAAVDAQVLGPAMGLTRDLLGQVVDARFVAAGGAQVRIVAAKRTAASVQNDVEWVEGLTADALDRLHRFTRLTRRVGWSVPELDLVLETLAETALGPSGLESVAALHALQARLGVTVAEQCSLVGAIPGSPIGKSLFDRLFNQPSFLAADGALPKTTTRFIHPAFRQSTSAPVDPALPRLLAGFAVSLDDLAALTRSLAPHLAQEASPGFDPNAADEDKRYFVLSSQNLALLYRHARLARLLHVTVDELFQLLGFIGLDRVAGLPDLLALIELHDWRGQSGYDLDDVAVAVGRAPRDPSRYLDAAAVAQKIADSSVLSLMFVDTVFAATLGTTEQGSRDLIASNPGILESPAAGVWFLSAGIDLDTVSITIPATATVPTTSGTQLLTTAQVRGALRPYLAADVLVRNLAGVLGFTKDKVVALAALSGQALTTHALVKAVRGDGPLQPVTMLISAMRPLVVAFAESVWDAAALDFVRHHPEAFGTDLLPQMAADAQHPHVPFVSLAQLRGLSTYARLAQRQLSAASDALTVSPADLQAVLTAFKPVGSSFPPSSDAAMARILGVPVGLLVGLRGRVALPASAASALDQLDLATQLASTVGVDGETFVAVVSDDYSALSHAADALGAALGARYADETARAAKLEETEQPIREAKRDALADYLIHSSTPKVWSTLEDLYEYFLIDVASGGCESTSRVVAATMSAQLYVYRAIMNLEQDGLPANDPAHVALRMPEGPALEWAWRKSYRVWQANRQVFLWPENYIDPDLRDDKTPLFKELEQELLQTDISDQNVLDAYTKYLTGFEEVASLTIAGAYHDVRPSGPTSANPASDVLHLFGATASDPPVYYYRTCENLIAGGRDPNVAAAWSPWQKIAVQITGRKVSPVVHNGRLHVFWTDIKSRSQNQIKNGSSTFAGYQHKMSLKFVTLRADGSWTVPQEVQIAGSFSKGIFGPARGQILDPLPGGLAKLDPAGRYQLEAIDDYTLSGPNWDWVWLRSSTHLELRLRNFLAYVNVDLFARRTTGAELSSPALSHPRLLCAKNTTSGAAAAALVKSARAAAKAVANVDLEADAAALTKASNAGDSAAIAEAQQTLKADTIAVSEAKAAIDKAAAGVAAKISASASELKPLYSGTPAWMPQPWSAVANAVIDEERIDSIALESPALKPMFQSGLYTKQIATIPATSELLALPGSIEDGLLQVGRDLLLLQGSVTDDGGYVLHRLGTTLVEDIARRLFEDGLDSLLDTQTQLALAEAGLPITLVGTHIEDRSNTGKLDFSGPYGAYYRELFLHIPFLIANALNSRGRFESSQRWYHYLFDPTASEVIDTTGVPAEDVAHRLLDRVWRYRELRGLDVERLRDILTDEVAIALYKRDPFNPWAIARRRISAFQKTLVMKYVDNLLDWADSLFSQFTMESVNEARMLYIMASDVLGPRPTKLGECGADALPRTYDEIGPLLDGSNEILVELETWMLGARVAKGTARVIAAEMPKYAIEHAAVVHAILRSKPPFRLLDTTAGGHVSAPASASTVQMFVAPQPSAAPATLPDRAPTPEHMEAGMFRGMGWNQARTASWGPALGNASLKTVDKLGGRSFEHAWKEGFSDRMGGFGWSILRQISPAFCVPANADLLAFWDRVEDRLYKIRHCMDIDGQKRSLALFAPPIDPMQLVAMKAAGLSLDDVLGATNGDLPPYRFLYLIERAKSFASSLSGFGAALLSALEKKDGEHLNRVRLAQQMNLAQLTTQIRQLDIQTASESLEAIQRQQAAAQYRSDFYAGLISQDRNGWEMAESISRHTASGIKTGAVSAALLASVLGLIPQLGSPFAMKYGGVELHASLHSFAEATGMVAGIAEGVAGSASLEANFARRSEGWAHQKTLADHDLKSLDRQLTAARIRLDIANRSLALHEKSIDQLQEFLDLTDGKFTSLGLYTWMSTQLQRLYRGAYQNALALSKLAEQAYRFERGDTTAPGLAASYWDPARAGLLAGEQMLFDLQVLERRFIETNYRPLEVDQAFALSQIDAQALIDLRETGECRFTVSEVFFDLSYPGHYKRRIKAARLTIPCITGPYVNVSATLNLDKSWLRKAVAIGASIVEVPPSRSVSVATSTAQNDSGVFELSFRDERYMPFEGLGAVSQWHLTLPKAFRQFDYQTINDVILSISYTAEQDGALRERVEAQNKALEGSIVHYFSSNPIKRLFSLRQDFSSAFTRLLRSPAGTQVKLELTERNFPLFVRGRNIHVERGVVLLRTASGTVPAGFKITIDGTAISVFSLDTTLGGLPGGALPSVFTTNLRGPHTLVVDAAGALAASPGLLGDTSAVDAEKLLDVLLYLEFKLA